MKLKKFNENFDELWDEEEFDKKTYTVEVKEISYGYIEVEATSEDDAIEKAQEEYGNTGAYWGNTEVDFEIQKVNESIGGFPSSGVIQQESSTEECPNCKTTNVKRSSWIEGARLCRNCGAIWDIEHPEKFKLT